ncbi:hypothetical protein EVAR_87594_1 [Eumeta japonica]|uniref:Uncharacterized protein n=1 Tax=Eumeta variegata TaxID=151549 RepID=A0A4C1WPF6_EUMVA|nr:hypothetical protein EVAR_87594_1 [Eumeta japonica]
MYSQDGLKSDVKTKNLDSSDPDLFKNTPKESPASAGGTRVRGGGAVKFHALKPPRSCPPGHVQSTKNIRMKTKELSVSSEPDGNSLDPRPRLVVIAIAVVTAHVCRHQPALDQLGNLYVPTLQSEIEECGRPRLSVGEVL